MDRVVPRGVAHRGKDGILVGPLQVRAHIWQMEKQILIVGIDNKSIERIGPLSSHRDAQSGFLG